MMNNIKYISILFLGIVTKFMGGYDIIFETLFFMIVLDFITGIIKAAVHNRIKSTKCFVGLIKKFYIFIVIALSVKLQEFLGDDIPLREVVIFFYITNEGISLIENIGVFIPIPIKIKEVFKKLEQTLDK